MTVYIVDLEAVETRYTAQWKEHLPKQMRAAGLEVEVISGGDVPQATTPGAFLNFAGTNSYKSQQLLKISEMFADGSVKAGDYFLYTDAWNPTVIQLKYMSELLGIPVKIGGMWHAGSYDPQDFLGRLIGDTPWVRNAETSMFHCYDHNFFATEFHANLFVEVMFECERCEVQEIRESIDSIKLVGWPMEYLIDAVVPYINTPKKDKIIFPHRLAPEKQVEIFRDLSASMPQYEWFVAQDQTLSKDEYYKHMAESKIVFSANLQETLGISAIEGAMIGTVPLLPSRLSYAEMWDGYNFYPSQWTESFESYQKHKTQIIDLINIIMKTDLKNTSIRSSGRVFNKFFTGKELYNCIKSSK